MIRESTKINPTTRPVPMSGHLAISLGIPFHDQLNASSGSILLSSLITNPTETPRYMPLSKPPVNAPAILLPIDQSEKSVRYWLSIVPIPTTKPATTPTLTLLSKEVARRCRIYIHLRTIPFVLFLSGNGSLNHPKNNPMVSIVINTVNRNGKTVPRI